MDEPTPEHHHLFPETRGWRRGAGKVVPPRQVSFPGALPRRAVSRLPPYSFEKGRRSGAGIPPATPRSHGAGEPEAPRAKPGCAGPGAPVASSAPAQTAPPSNPPRVSPPKPSPSRAPPPPKTLPVPCPGLPGGGAPAAPRPAGGCRPRTAAARPAAPPLRSSRNGAFS